MADVSVIIPTWNRADLLDTLLPALRTQTQPPDEILVVDNGSTDHTWDVCERHGAHIISLPTNVGFPAAINEGVAQSTGEWLVLLNNDVSLAPTWLERLRQAAEQQPALFATGKLLQERHRDRIDGTWDMVSRAAYAWRCGFGHVDGALWSQRREIWFAPMTAALFHRTVFDRIGTLDARFEAYYEDVDFGIRCALAGIRGVYEPTAVATHMGKSTLGKRGARVFFLTARNQVLLLAKHYSPRTLRRFAWPILIGQTLSVVAAATHGHLFSALRGKWAGFRRWSAFRGSAVIHDNEAVMEAALVQSEREIRDIQQAIGFDPYWRFYFRLVRSQ